MFASVEPLHWIGPVVDGKFSFPARTPLPDPTVLFLLEAIPQKPPRSKLETHRELIRQLRKGRTYRDIVRILHERVGLNVAVSTIHSFIKVRAKHRKQVQLVLLPTSLSYPSQR